MPRLSTLKKSHCRFCAQEKNCTELDSLATNLELRDQLIKMLKFLRIDYVNLFNSKLPTTTCLPCYEEILKSYNFFLNVKECQNILVQLYCKGEDQNDDIKSEPLDHLDFGENVKQEESTENDIFESKPNILNHLLSSQDTSNLKTENFEFILKTGPNDPLETMQVFIINLTEENSDSNLNSELEHKWDDTSILSEESNSSNTETEFNDNNNKKRKIQKQKKKEEIIETINENKKTKSDQLNHNTDSSISVLETNSEKSEEVSWASYPWHCIHCKLKFDTMQDLRSHSTQLHKRCFAYKCADCRDSFNMFNLFVEHVRRHRNELRLYCPHCNERFSSVAGCTQHVLAYWSSGHKICNWCGEVYPNADALKTHKSMSRQVRLPKRDKKKIPRVVKSLDQLNNTWEDYEWRCLECELGFVSVGDLRAHSQAVHDKCFAMRCADCLAVKYEYPSFVTHVVAHRPVLGKYCPYCNQRFEDANELKKHVEDHFTGAQRPCYSCGQIFHNKDDETQHLENFSPTRVKKYMNTEDLTCSVCKRVLGNIAALKSHKKTHDETKKKDHFCHLCGKQFKTKVGLKYHLETHNNDKTYECKVCYKSFSKRTLRHHVMSHTKQFICDHCSKGFTHKHELRLHIDRSHNNYKVIKKFDCTYCSKKFGSKSNLKSHLNVHTGATPYQCENCEKTFTNWANCNKHMMRIHGTTLAKYKVTERGKIPIGKKLPEITTNVKDWMAEVTELRRDTKSKKGKTK